MDFIEETTPKGITLKVTPKKWNFLAFDQKGASIYADRAGTKVLHRVPLVTFIGGAFQVRNTAHTEFSFLKVSKNRIVVPYVDSADSRRKYVFVEMESAIDLIPVRLKELRDIAALVREIDAGEKPDGIVVDSRITKNDIIIIKNRFSEARIILAGNGEKAAEAPVEAGEINKFADRRATEVIKEININTMSSNPVFLARVHLREMDLSKVNQLILDFDLSVMEVEYILSFITTMLGKAESDDELKKNGAKLHALSQSLQFYIGLLNRDAAQTRSMIEGMSDSSLIASFSTLLAKVKLLFPGTDDQLAFTDYENLLWEKKTGVG
jgi:hypothetical protein